MTERSPFSVWGIVQVAAVVAVLGVFLFQTLTLLNPVMLFVLLWAITLPFRGRPGYLPLVLGAATLTGFWVLANTGSILAPFILSLTLAYILDPLVDRLETKGLSRTIAVLMLIIPSMVIIGALCIFFIPAAFRQTGDLLNAIPVLVQRLAEWLEIAQARLATVDAPIVEDMVSRIEAVDSEAVVAFFQERQADLGAWSWNTAMGVGRGLGSVATILSYAVLTPVLTFYLIRDWDHVVARIGRLVPPGRRERILGFVAECDDLVSRYMRGQLTVAFIIGVLTAVGLTIARFQYAGTIGLIAGVFSIVPFLGIIVTLIPATFIALVSGNVLISLLKVGVVFGVIQMLDGALISPRVVGDSVGIHPVLVVLAMSMGGFFFGVVGLLIAVPVAAVLKLLAARGLEGYLASDFYTGADDTSGADAPGGA